MSEDVTCKECNYFIHKSKRRSIKVNDEGIGICPNCGVALW